MDETERENLRAEFLAKARASQKLFEGETAQYWKFHRRAGSNSGPLLYIGKTRTVIHLKNAQPSDARWVFIPASDPKHVGGVHEIRLEGDVADIRDAFNVGFAKLVNSP